MAYQSLVTPSSTIMGNSMLENDEKENFLSVRREHGIGNVLMLLQVLDSHVARGGAAELVTRECWCKPLADLMPRISFTHKARPETVDLDELTNQVFPSKHRTYEFAELLGLPRPIALALPHLCPPAAWCVPYQYLQNCVVFAGEASHKARCWPDEYQKELCEHLRGSNLVLIGTDKRISLPSEHDLRERTSLKDLFAILSFASVVISMDSGVLHIASSLATPVVGIYSCVDPRYRTYASSQIITLQSNISCVPCNKDESCDGIHSCISDVTPFDVIHAVDHIRSRYTLRQIWRVTRGQLS